MFRVGLIGAGFMGGLHAAGWARTPARLAAVFSLDRDEMESIATTYDAQVAESVEALIDSVDVVDICTPTHLHHPMVLQAAAAGKHIVCEKPLARTIAQAEEMIAACEQAGVKLLVGHVVRYFPQYAQAKTLVDQGEVGRVGVVRLKRVSFRPKRPIDNWFLDTAKSGGMMLDLMLHDFDYARWVAGNVKSVFAKNVSSHTPDAPGDYALVILRHTSGALSNVEGGWAYPPPMFRTAFEIAGDGGLIEFPPEVTNPLAVNLMAAPGGDLPDIAVPSSPLAEDPYTTEIKDFYNAIANDAAPRVTPQDALAALRIAFAAIESAQTGQRVLVEEVH